MTNIPFGHVNTLKYIIDRESRSKGAQQAKQAEVIEDAVNGDM